MFYMLPRDIYSNASLKKDMRLQDRGKTVGKNVRFHQKRVPKPPTPLSRGIRGNLLSLNIYQTHVSRFCTAYGFLDHSLKEDCATMQSH